MVIQEFPVYPAGFWIAVAAVVGASIGSFLNVVAYRLPRMLELVEGAPDGHETYNLAQPGSHCPACQSPIKLRNNIPIFSWLILRGRCPDCSERISVRYPLMEIVAAAAFAAVVWHWGVSFEALAVLVFVSMSLVLAMIDLEHTLLPDALVFPLLWLGLIVNGISPFVPLEMALWGAVVGYVSLRLLGWFWEKIRGMEALGRGDCKLAAALGAWVGLHGLAIVLFVGSLATAIAGLVMRRGMRGTLPLGPGLVAGGVLVMFWMAQGIPGLDYADGLPFFRAHLSPMVLE